MAIPGVGPIVAAGWLVATLTGAAAGGSDRRRRRRTDAGRRVERGSAKSMRKACAAAARWSAPRSPMPTRARLQAVMDRSSVRIGDRATAYRKAGWKSFDPAATPYTPEQVRRERELYR